MSEPRNLSKQEESYSPQPGTWTLTAPDGRQWKADSPLKCAGMEQKERVPATVALARITAEADKWCEGALWLLTIGDDVIVRIERNRRWIDVIRERSGVISHIVEIGGIDQCLEKEGLL